MAMKTGSATDTAAVQRAGGGSERECLEAVKHPCGLSVSTLRSYGVSETAHATTSKNTKLYNTKLFKALGAVISFILELFSAPRYIVVSLYALTGKLLQFFIYTLLVSIGKKFRNHSARSSLSLEGSAIKTAAAGEQLSVVLPGGQQHEGDLVVREESGQVVGPREPVIEAASGDSAGEPVKPEVADSEKEKPPAIEKDLSDKKEELVEEPTTFVKADLQRSRGGDRTSSDVVHGLEVKGSDDEDTAEIRSLQASVAHKDEAAHLSGASEEETGVEKRNDELAVFDEIKEKKPPEEVEESASDGETQAVGSGGDALSQRARELAQEDEMRKLEELADEFLVSLRALKEAPRGEAQGAALAALANVTALAFVGKVGDMLSAIKADVKDLRLQTTKDIAVLTETPVAQ